MFQQVYDSALHHPGMAFALALAFAVVLASRQRFVLGFTILFLAEIVADAFFTGAYTPLANTRAMTPVAIAFVILGDARYYVAIELALRHEGAAERTFRSRAAWLVGLGCGFIVPVLTVGPQLAVPDFFAVPRHVFLLHEAIFFVLTLVVRFVILPRRFAKLGTPPDVARWTERITIFFMVQYACWSLADIIILSGVEAGLLFRLVPNFLYYAAFVPFVWWTAPARLRDQA